MLHLTTEQDNALNLLSKHDFNRPFVIGGCAGTGKTTLLKALAESHRKALFLAPTGKAVQVLKSKLPSSTTVKTVHSALYTPVEVTDKDVENAKKTAIKLGDSMSVKRYEYLHTLKSGIGVDFFDKGDTSLFDTLVVVDEASMLGTKEYRKLVDSGAKIVLVGDPFQLQPVNSASVMPAHIEEYDAFLKTVHRAALESPITRMATEIRANTFSGMLYWKENGIHVVNSFDKDYLLSFGQVITGMNATRHRLNREIRLPVQGYSPLVGDKVLIKQNNNKIGVVNGDIGTVTKASQSKMSILFPDERLVDNLLFNNTYFRETYQLQAQNDIGIKADFGYVITAHASQGSEWDSVAIFDDGFRRDHPLDRRRWMYTAATRAKRDLSIIRVR